MICHALGFLMEVRMPREPYAPRTTIFIGQNAPIRRNIHQWIGSLKTRVPPAHFADNEHSLRSAAIFFNEVALVLALTGRLDEAQAVSAELASSIRRFQLRTGSKSALVAAFTPEINTARIQRIRGNYLLSNLTLSNIQDRINSALEENLDVYEGLRNQSLLILSELIKNAKFDLRSSETIYRDKFHFYSCDKFQQMSNFARMEFDFFYAINSNMMCLSEYRDCIGNIMPVNFEWWVAFRNAERRFIDGMISECKSDVNDLINLLFNEFCKSPISHDKLSYLFNVAELARQLELRDVSFSAMEFGVYLSKSIGDEFSMIKFGLNSRNLFKTSRFFEDILSNSLYLSNNNCSQYKGDGGILREFYEFICQKLVCHGEYKLN